MTGEFTVAVHALCLLSYYGCALSSEELANGVCTNPVRVRMVMSKLKKAGFVIAKGGTKGGYSAADGVPSLTLKDVLCAVDSQLVAEWWKSGSHDIPCLICSGMTDVMGGIHEALERSAREELRHYTIADVTARLVSLDESKKADCREQTQI